MNVVNTLGSNYCGLYKEQQNAPSSETMPGIEKREMKCGLKPTEKYLELYKLATTDEFDFGLPPGKPEVEKEIKRNLLSILEDVGDSSDVIADNFNQWNVFLALAALQYAEDDKPAPVRRTHDYI